MKVLCEHVLEEIMQQCALMPSQTPVLAGSAFASGMSATHACYVWTRFGPFVLRLRAIMSRPVNLIVLTACTAMERATNL